MDEKERFDIRRKVLAENGMDFEDYIGKQQAEIDELKRCLKHLLYGDPSGRGTQATITEWAKELIQDKGE